MGFIDNARTELYNLVHKQKKIADVGIELEVEGQYLPETVPHWQTKSEGSLQNGLEYVTKPIKIETVRTYVNGLREYINGHGGIIVPSYRCSTHIHCNMLPEKLEDVLGFMVVFTMFEPVLLALCGPQRDGNLFCLSNYDTGEVVSSFDKMCQQFERITTHGYAFERGKYSALNSGRLIDLGTWEARCFPLSMDGFVVEKWCRWLLKMLALTRNADDKTFRSLWKSVRSASYWHASQIFEEDVTMISNVHDLMELGTETAYELTKVLKKYYSKPQTATPKRGKKLGAQLNAQYMSYDVSSGSFNTAPTPTAQPMWMPTVDADTGF